MYRLNLPGKQHRRIPAAAPRTLALTQIKYLIHPGMKSRAFKCITQLVDHREQYIVNAGV